MEALPILILLTLILISIAIPFIIRSLLWNSILKKIYAGKYDQAIDQMHQSKLYRLVFSEYERNYNLLRTYISKKDVKQIQALSIHMLQMDLNRKQAYQVASLTYFYFLESENKEMCDTLLHHIRISGDVQEIGYDEMLYRILIEKKAEDILALEELLKEKTDKDDIGMLQYLIGVQYLNKKELKQANLYLNKAKNNLKGTPYHKKINKLLGGIS